MALATIYAPTSELEAVNAILASIGEAAVNTISGPISPDTAQAIRCLHEKNREVQSKGWSFNTDFSLTLSPTLAGEIILPPNSLRVDAPQYPAAVYRGGKLYDNQKHTYVFSGPVAVDLVIFLPFNDLPEAVRRYIVVSAGRKFQDLTLGDESLHRFTQLDEEAAKSAMDVAEALTSSFNVLSDSRSVAQTFKKRNR